MAIRTKDYNIVESSSGYSIVLDLKEKDFLILALLKIGAALRKQQPELIEEIKIVEEARILFDKYIDSVEFTPLKGSKKWKYKYSLQIEDNAPDKETIIARVKEIIDAPFIKQIIYEAIITPKKKGDLLIPATKPHKQSRTNLKTLAKIVGRDTTQPSLFSLPLEKLQEAIEQHKTEEGIPYKDKISKNVGVLSLQLLREYQHTEKDDEGYISISDLGSLAAELKTDTKELKYYLLYLGGYQYPSVTFYDEQKEIGLQLAKLFDIEFRYSRKYENAEGIISPSIESRTIRLLIDTPIKRIRVKPSAQFIKDLEGKKGQALGYIHVNNNFIALCRGLSDYAFKLLNYMATGRPDYKIAEDKLFKHLGLEDQVKQQKPARIRARLSEAFKELHEKGHLKEYSVPADGEGLYSWIYTDKYVQHETTRKKEPAALEYVDFNDESIPLETRRKAYKDWLIKSKGKSPAEAERRANGKYKA